MVKVVSCILSLIVFIGLPIIGWGIFDISGFFQNQARTIYIIMMTVLTIIVVLFVPDERNAKGPGSNTGSSNKSSKGSNLYLSIIQIIPLILMVIAPYSDSHNIAVINDGNLIRFIGIGSALIGHLVMNWAIIIFDKEFNTRFKIQDNHKIVKKGPYKIIRHPRYLGLILFFTGISFVFVSIISIVLVLASIAIFLRRIYLEENMMYEEFKQEWIDYKKKTYSMIPYIY